MWHIDTVNSVTTDRSYDISKARKGLGFKPEYGLRRSLEETVQWYQANGYLRRS